MTCRAKEISLKQRIHHGGMFCVVFGGAPKRSDREAYTEKECRSGLPGIGIAVGLMYEESVGFQWGWGPALGHVNTMTSRGGSCAVLGCWQVACWIQRTIRGTITPHTHDINFGACHLSSKHTLCATHLFCFFWWYRWDRKGCQRPKRRHCT